MTYSSRTLLDLVRLGQLVARPLGPVLELLADDVVAELDALVADEHRRPGDELADLVLALAAERAVQQLAVVVTPAGIFSSSMALIGCTVRAEGLARSQFLIAWRPTAKQSTGTAKSLYSRDCMTALQLFGDL